MNARDRRDALPENRLDPRAGTPPTLPERTAEAGDKGPLPDVPDEAYPEGAERLPEPEREDG